MAKRKTTKRRRRRYTPKRYRKRRKTTIPMEVLIAAGSHIAMPAFPAYPSNTPIKALTEGDFKEFMKQEAMGWTGIDVDNPAGINIMDTLNPFNFGRAAYWKVLFWAGIASKFRKKLVPQSSKLFQKIPWIGRWVS